MLTNGFQILNGMESRLKKRLVLIAEKHPVFVKRDHLNLVKFVVNALVFAKKIRQGHVKNADKDLVSA
jgi:hypothetical protein